ncbi:uncharacterized protein LOC127806823 isoform X2 [Diospyros lotus]|uniref:uncharacterized protein LOC127806823 isoform X2 n=1 Tax=Diospyros lotus TaxID=55363 RepID=UPI00225AE8C7|nr:uncharacterized protein LOC127806823 isoform X2 [Diospyros lotus]
MNLLKIQKPSSFSIGRSTPPHRPSLSPPHLHLPTLLAEPQPWLLSASPTLPSIFRPRVSSDVEAARVWGDREDDEEERRCEEDLAPSSAVYQNTLRLVECSMFAAVSGLAYFLSNSLAIENYFGCFFALPIVISSMRWGIAAGRKTMVATAMLLLVLSGPVKALTYLVKGKLGSFSLLVRMCSSFRCRGITVNIHASLTYIITGVGINTIPSMNLIYTIFGTLVMLNCGFFVFLLHILYAVFFTRLGMKASLTLPRWLEKAI